MALKQFNPTSPGRRFMSTLTFEEVTKDHPEKSLTEPKKRSGGRDSRGRISVRFIGGGHKRRYRIVDFRRDKRDITTPIVPRGWPFCTTATARSATSLPRRGSGSGRPWSRG